MLTVDQLKAMPAGTVFATGVVLDVPDGLFMANTGKELRWIACRGKGYHDWTIYCHFSEHSIKWIERHGDKVFLEENIRKLVFCDDEAFGMYRY